MPDIFLSYTREDLAAAQRFAEGFAGQGYSVWWDVTLRSGEAYDQVTEEALRTAKAVVVLWSKKSVMSRWVRAEATLADRNGALVPAMIEPCERPIMFELTQTADLSRWNGQPTDPAWRAFLADVGRFVERGALRTTASPAQAQAAPPSLQSARPALAVMPFINRSGREADDVFADDMVEDLTAALSVGQWVTVVAASRTAAYRHGARDLRQIGRDVGARYLLEGNMRRVGEDFRVTAQLVEAESGAILWTQKFDRPVAELSALQDDLVAEVAAHLRDQVHRVEMDHALRQAGNMSPWDAVMRADAYSGHATRPGYEAAIAEHKRALAINPNDSETAGGLVAAQGQLWRLRGGDDPELAQEILSNIRRARALDPNNPVMLFGVASALGSLRKLQDALPLAERAVAIAPNFEVARIVLGSILIRLGRLDEGLAEMAAAERLAPNSIWGYRTSMLRSVAYLRDGRLPRALEAAERSVHLLPAPEALIQDMLCFAISDRWDRARDTMRRLRDADPEMSLEHVENIVRDFYSGSDAAGDYVAIVGRIWGEASSHPTA